MNVYLILIIMTLMNLIFFARKLAKILRKGVINVTEVPRAQITK